MVVKTNNGKNKNSNDDDKKEAPSTPLHHYSIPALDHPQQVHEERELVFDRNATVPASPMTQATGLQTNAGGAVNNETITTTTEYYEKKQTTLTDDDDSSTVTNVNESLFQCMTGMKQDLQKRLPVYASDWGRPRNVWTVLNATVFAFVIQLIPALIFAELMDRTTEGNLAIAETLLSSAIIGIVYAVAAGQPLVIMGITGPVAILLGTSYRLTETFNAEYFPFFFWICIWAGLMHVLSAMVGLVSLVWSVTPFTSQIFELFIAITFIYASVRDLIEPLYLGQEDVLATERSEKYATFFLGLLTYQMAWSLHFAETWTYLTHGIRVTLTAYNTLFACVIVTAVSYLPGIDQSSSSSSGGDGIDRVNVRFTPWDWQPTADRPWIATPFDGIDVKGIFGAIVPGFMFFLLFIIDHNVSSILTQSPKFNLQKSHAYHWDFFVLGLTFIPCAVLGLPPGNGLIPQAPLHARALCTREYRTDEHGVKHEIVTHVEDQRWSGLGQACLMFVALSAFEVISWIPRGCLFGLFLYLGRGALHGNEIWERVTLCFMMSHKRPAIPIVRNVKSWWTVVAYTSVQVACAFCIFGVAQFASVGYIYPALLTALVPFRSYILSRWFAEEDLEYLDPVSETEEEYHEEQRAIHKAERRGSMDSEDMNFPKFGEFRAKGIAHELHELHHPHHNNHNHHINPPPQTASENLRTSSQEGTEIIMQQNLDVSFLTTASPNNSFLTASQDIVPTPTRAAGSQQQTESLLQHPYHNNRNNNHDEDDDQVHAKTTSMFHGIYEDEESNASVTKT